MLGPLTVVDLTLIAVSLLSALLAMYRGLTRELLSITSWLVAGAAVLYFVQYHKKFAEEMFDPKSTLFEPVEFTDFSGRRFLVRKLKDEAPRLPALRSADA